MEDEEGCEVRDGGGREVLGVGAEARGEAGEEAGGAGAGGGRRRGGCDGGG